MSNANKTQVGGNHYQTTYQHWDMVCDTNLHYLLGCATKYLARWRTKNGLQDLAKAKHFIHKARERNVEALNMDEFDKAYTWMEENNFDQGTYNALDAILMGDYPYAEQYIDELMQEQIEAGLGDATPAYVNQD